MTKQLWVHLVACASGNTLKSKAVFVLSVSAGEAVLELVLPLVRDMKEWRHPRSLPLTCAVQPPLELRLSVSFRKLYRFVLKTTLNHCLSHIRLFQHLTVSASSTCSHRIKSSFLRETKNPPIIRFPCINFYTW